MEFEDALRAVKDGKKARRQIWRARGLAGWLEMVQPVLSDGRPIMPLLVMTDEAGIVRPFAGAIWDLLADDWELAQP